ncbi:MAG: protein kinase [Acidobacteria bacterium]|nr:protein kinase [Acidobacteriota bacterium]
MEYEITSERWRQVKQIFQTAVEIPTAERAAWLAEACVDDPALLSEIESLIAVHKETGSFLETPAFELVPQNTLVGESLGRYRIMELLGRGGMGEVYKAKDTTLGRDVAIKVLHSNLSIDQDRLRRFVQEARAASALNHPNIITIHEFGYEDGVHFIISEFIEGETLRRRIASERINAGEIPEIAMQITGALIAAHEAGIVHRDIKPENVMVRPDGLVKVLDFGLAKLIERRTFDTVMDAHEASEATTAVWGGGETGMVMGTFNYMSPEQARGQKLDARTDIFSLGVVLYEMAAGHSPFARATAADTIASILEKDPLPLAQFNSGVPDTLERIIHKALAKDRKERYQTARELLNDLKCLHNGDAVIALPAAKKDNRHFLRYWRGAAIALAALIAIFAGTVQFSKGDKAIESIAVLPFTDVDGNPETEYLADGITEEVNNSLIQLSNLKVRPCNSVCRDKRRDIDPLAAGRELKVEAVLTVQVARRGDEITVSLQLINVRENRQLWGTRFQRRSADLSAMHSQIAREVSQSLRMQLPHREQERLAKRRHINPEAYQAYLKGRYHWNKRNAASFRKAIEYFNEAIARDPNYALAYVGLADCYVLMSGFSLPLPPTEVYPKAKEAVMKALQIDNQLAEAHASLARIKLNYDWDWPGAEKEFKLAIDIDPNYPTAHQWYSVFLSYMGRHEEAIAEARRAYELDPLSLAISGGLVRAYCRARQHEQAIEHCLKILELDPHAYVRLNNDLELAYEQLGMYEQAIAARLKAMTALGDDSGTIAALTAASIKSGWKGYLQKTADLRMESALRGDISRFDMARIYARLGNKDRAFEWLEKAYAEHSSEIVSIKSDPAFDQLRADTRFQDLLHRIGLAP